MIVDNNDIIAVRTSSGLCVETKYYVARDLQHSMNEL